MQDMPRPPSKTNEGYLALFATVIVVCGIAAVAYVSSQNETGIPSSTSGTAAGSQDDAQKMDRPAAALLLLNENAATVMDLYGKSERLEYREFENRYAGSDLPAEGSAAANGSPVYLHMPLAPTGTGFISPNRKTIATLGAPQTDGAGTVMLNRGPQPPDKIVLRLDKNKPLREVALWGWFDEMTIMASGMATSGRALFAVKTDGGVSRVADLPDNVILMQGRNKAFWYSTGEMGEGLESRPTGPAEFRRLTSDGVQETVVRDEKLTFVSILPGPEDVVAFTDDSGQSYAMNIGQPESRVALGKRRPLVFLDKRFLVLRENFDLILFDLQMGSFGKIGPLPEGGVSVFVLPATIDNR